MERHAQGVVNAYILNLMVHQNTLKLDEQEIRDRIEKRFRQTKKRRMRPQNVRQFHLEPLIERRWLREVGGRYERVGKLRHVKPEWTLSDQFEGVEEEYVDSYIYEMEYNRNMSGADDFESSLTEEEYNIYIQKTYAETNEEYKRQTRKLTGEEKDELYKEIEELTRDTTGSD